MSDHDAGVRGFIRALMQNGAGSEPVQIENGEAAPPRTHQRSSAADRRGIVVLVVLLAIVALGAISYALNGPTKDSTRSRCEQMYQDNQATADVPSLSPRENEDRYVNNCIETQHEIDNGDFGNATP